MTGDQHKKRLLIHTCCGPCLLGAYEAFTDEAYLLAAYFYNPNIHPLIEFRRRIKAIKVLQESCPVQVHYVEQYGLVEFLGKVDWRSTERCRQCYTLRLSATASFARKMHFDAFTTTMLISKHQKHELIKTLAEEIAAQTGVEFVYKDLRPFYESAHGNAKKRTLYLQTYCGCIFSEFERYQHTTLHLYKGISPEKSREPQHTENKMENAGDQRRNRRGMSEN